MKVSVALLLLCAGAVFASSSCSSMQCGASDQCCSDSVNGPVCYNPATSDCVGGTKLCGKGEGACGNACYDTTMYSCTSDGQLLQGGSSPSSQPLFCSTYNVEPCGQTEMCCNQECYNPETHSCVNYFLCPLNYELCSEECFNPANQECCNNVVYAKGASVCSSESATCCSCSCDPLGGTMPQSFTVGSANQCNDAYISSQFGGLECPGAAGGCGDDCVVSCGDEQFIFNYCFSDAQYGCTGHYLCSGGNYSCGVSSGGGCALIETNTGTSVTQTSPGTTTYAAIPAGYQGDVCCWCGSESTYQATSVPVNSTANCNVAGISESTGYPFPSDGVCRVWSPFTPLTPIGPGSYLACGLPL